MVDCRDLRRVHGLVTVVALAMASAVFEGPFGRSPERSKLAEPNCDRAMRFHPALEQRRHPPAILPRAQVPPGETFADRPSHRPRSCFTRWLDHVFVRLIILLQLLPLLSEQACKVGALQLEALGRLGLITVEVS